MEQNSSIFSFRNFRTPLIIVSTFILLEIIFRVYNFGAHTALNWYKHNPQGILLTDLAMGVEDPEISWKLRPNMQEVLKTQKFTTNSQGFRNPEFKLEKEEGTTRITCLGRSITMGSGVQDEEVFTQVLQERFNSQGPDSIEIINCGVGGYSFKQMLDYYEVYVAPLDPDIVIIPISPKDLANGMYRTPLPLSAAKTSLTNLKYYLSFTFTYNVMKTIVKRATENFMSVDWKYRMADKENQDSVPMTSEPMLAAFIEKRAEEGVKCYFFSPDRHAGKRVHDTTPIQTFLDGYESAEYLAIEDFLVENMPENRYLYFSDTHPSPAMHAALAEALYVNLKARLVYN